MLFGFSLLVWGLIVAVLVIASMLTEMEYFMLSGIAVMIGFVIAHFAFGIQILAIFASPITFVFATVVYLAIGAGVSLLKYYRYCSQNSGLAAEEFKRYVKNTSLTMEEFAKDSINFSLHPKRNKKKLFAWLLYWPEVVLLFLLKDPFVWIGRMVYSVMSGTYQRIAETALKAALK